LDNARERRFGNGREPRVLWKNHADFIAILLQMVLQMGGKRKRDRTSRRGCTMSWPAYLLRPDTVFEKRGTDQTTKPQVLTCT
jgi:hypothetical protein